MANVIITSSANIIIVDFGVYFNAVGYKKATFQKKSISFQLTDDELFVRAEDASGNHWAVSYNIYGESLVIDSVDGIAPTDNENLFDLLTDLIA